MPRGRFLSVLLQMPKMYWQNEKRVVYCGVRYGKRVNSMKIQIQMPSGVRYIIDKLAARGFEAYAVGGCVRDSLMGKTPNDWDITTDAEPADMLAVFKGHKVIPTGIKHGTVTILCKGGKFEVTTYRVDGAYTDGRRPAHVTFSKSLEEDLKRRDFTINAMAYNEEQGLKDFFGGEADLARRLVRCVGDARERFGEDYLRMLRAYRFAATLGFTLDAAAADAIREGRECIKGISAERIQSELAKLLLSGNISMTRAFFDVFAGVLLPEALQGGEEMYARRMDVLGRVDNVLALRLAAVLFGGEGAEKAAVPALKRLKFDNETIELTAAVVRLSGWEIPAVRREMKRLAAENSAAYARHALRFRVAAQADGAEEALDLLEAVLASGEPCGVADLAVNGKDVMDTLGVPPGKIIGETLQKLLSLVWDEPEANTRERLLAELKA